MNTVTHRRGRARLLLATLLMGAAPVAAQPAQPLPPDAAGIQASATPLRGLVLLDGADRLRAGGVAEVPAGGVDAGRIAALAGPEARAALAPFLGRALDLPLLGEVRRAILAYLNQVGRPFAAVTVPPQDATSGVIQIVVTESRLGRLTVDGARWFDEGQYLGAMRNRPGEPIDGTVLSADVNWINRNPFRQATVQAQAGTAPGTTDLAIRTQERFPVGVMAGVDNTGNRSSGLLRVNAGLEWGNALWRGDDATYRFTTSSDFSSLRQHSFGYVSNLAWRHTLSLSGSYANSRSAADALIGNIGVTATAALRYTVPLPDWGRLSHRLTAGYDFKSTNNDILFGGVSVFPTTSEVDQFVIDYGGQAQDSWGATSFSLALVGSPGGLTTHNNDAAFQSQQADARARYGYVRLFVDRSTDLPANFSLNNRLTAQATTGTLLSSEQLGFGGVQSVRGFIEQSASRDQGVLLQNELRAPVFGTGLASWAGLEPAGDQVLAFLFLDAGVGRNHNEAPGSASSVVRLVSAGPGVTWQVSRHGSASLSWGLPILRHNDPARSRLGVQFSVQLTL